MSFHDLVGDVEPETISEVAFCAVERLEKMSQGLVIHPVTVIPDFNFHHVAVSFGTEPNSTTHGYSLNCV
jgi:hypothetical protein